MNNSEPNSTPPPKKVKVKGPIRWEAVIPALVLTALVGAYFTFFFDGHLRRGLEYVGTQVNGAEVNIGSLRTSILSASLAIDDIQMTDKEHPERNLVEVGKIRFKMLWDALLRAKVVVDEASILEIQALSKRKSPGYVVPPPPPSNEPSAIDRVEKEVLSQTRKRFNDNFLGDVASMLGGTDPKDQLKALEGSLKSDAKIKQLQAELKTKKEEWDKRLKEMPQQKELKEYEGRVKALKFNTGNPVQFAADLKEADKIYKEVEGKVRMVKDTTRDVKGDLNNYSQAYKDLEKMVNDDLKDLQSRLKLPDVNAKEFSQQLLMGMVEKRIVGIRKYIEVGRKYMPPIATKEERKARKAEQLVPRKRGAGENYTFPITAGYPLFWLKHAAISSEVSSTNEYSGNIRGDIKDLTTSQSVVGRPTMILVKGDFPKQGISGLDATITLDHRTESPKETLVAIVGAFPLGQTKLADSSDVKLSIDGATGSSKLNATLANQEMNISMNNSFGGVKYGVDAKSKTVKDVLDGVLKNITTLTLNADVKGSFTDFDVNINSNLGEELAKGFQAMLQAKINEAKDKLRKSIDEKIGGEKAKLKAELDKATGDLTKGLDGKNAELDKALADIKGAGKGGNNKPEDKVKDEGKKLLKKFGF